MSLFCNVHVSLPYNAIHTNALTMRFFSWRLRHPHIRSFFLLKASFANAMRRLTSHSHLQSSVTILSKIAERCDWLQFFTVDHYSQLSALPPWHSHNFGLFHIYSHVVFLWRLLECIHYALKSTLGIRDHSLVVCKTDRLYQHPSNFHPFMYIFKSLNCSIINTEKS